MRTNTSKNLDGFQSVGEADGGLVPYTTSDTRATQAELAEMPALSALKSRLSRMKHHVRTAGRLIRETMDRRGRGWRAVFVTLTYKRSEDWSARDISLFLKASRQWAKRRALPLGYVWVAEMQKRGAVHYHVVFWLPAKCGFPRPDRWWKHGTTNIQSVKRNAIGYLMKYVSKGVGNYPDLPKGARVCGSGGLDQVAAAEFHYWRLPRYVRENVQLGERCTRAAGGGWISRLTGEVWRSAFGLFGIARVSRGLDVRGAPLRDDSVVLLSERYGRQAGGYQMPAAVIEAWREAVREDAYYTVTGQSIAYHAYLS